MSWYHETSHETEYVIVIKETEMTAYNFKVLWYGQRKTTKNVM
jgi:hypothetical protein